MTVNLTHLFDHNHDNEYPEIEKLTAPADWPTQSHDIKLAMQVLFEVSLRPTPKEHQADEPRYVRETIIDEIYQHLTKHYTQEILPTIFENIIQATAVVYRDMGMAYTDINEFITYAQHTLRQHMSEH
jgi:hypothetical protein